MKKNIVLSIAGFDGSGGAGLQADLKTFFIHDIYGLSVATSITAQNSKGVTGKLDIESSFFKKQLRTLLKDIEIKYI
uniref:bifunctional hydroxymethylpyrimidine kinase/phosphomethylpyrimidine kinase n=1 Tax=Thermococcus sp. TaxID=35749 RepID=UPI00261B355F